MDKTLNKLAVLGYLLTQEKEQDLKQASVIWGDRDSAI